MPTRPSRCETTESVLYLSKDPMCPAAYHPVPCVTPPGSVQGRQDAPGQQPAQCPGRAPGGCRAKTPRRQGGGEAGAGASVARSQRVGGTRCVRSVRPRGCSRAVGTGVQSVSLRNLPPLLVLWLPIASCYFSLWAGTPPSGAPITAGGPAPITREAWMTDLPPERTQPAKIDQVGLNGPTVIPGRVMYDG